MKSAQAPALKVCVGCDCQRLCCLEPHQTRSKGILTPQFVTRGMERSWGIGSGGAEFVQNHTYPHPGEQGQLLPGDKEKTLTSGFGGELGADLKALGGWGRRRCNSHGTECGDSCLHQAQLWARSGPHRSHLFARGCRMSPA